MKRSACCVRVLAVLAVVLLCIGAGVAWHKELRHHVFPRNFGVVTPNAIYRSGRLTPNMLHALRDDYGVRTLIDLGDITAGDETDLEGERLADELGMDRFRFNFSGDGTGDPNHYVTVLHLMTDPARQPVLVHCSAGAQRTSGAVILYRAIVEGVPVEVAYPESFEFKHDPDDYELLAYLADHLELIRVSYMTGKRLERDADGRWALTLVDSAHPTVRASAAKTGDLAE